MGRWFTAIPNKIILRITLYNPLFISNLDLKFLILHFKFDTDGSKIEKITLE